MKIIDIHTHTFPDKIAANALNNLSQSSKITYYSDGTTSGLAQSMKEGQLNLSVIMPIATKQGQCIKINERAKVLNETSFQSGLMSFATIHPDDDVKIVKDIATAGFKGIKLHPLFQDTYFDDIRYLRILDAAESNGLVTLVHGGYDISYPGIDLVTVPHILNVMKELNPKKLILAHMGGWGCWDDVESYLVGSDVYFDTAFTMDEIISKDGTPREFTPDLILSPEQFIRIVTKHGYDKILFGSDSPWINQHSSAERIKELLLPQVNAEEMIEHIWYKNTETLLNITAPDL